MVIAFENLEYRILIYGTPVHLLAKGRAVGFLVMSAKAPQLRVIQLFWHLERKTEQLYEQITKTVLHLGCCICKEGGNDLLHFGGQLREVHDFLY